jgi:hypothetical protein
MFFPPGYYLPPLALLLYFPFTLLIFRIYRPALAGIISATAAAMFLPEQAGFDLPGVPPLTKLNLPYIYMTVAVLISAPSRLLSARIGGRDDLLLLVLIAGGIVTALTNSDPLPYGERAGYRLQLYDGISYAIRNTLHYGLPFILGRALIRTSRDLRNLLIILVAFTAVYSLFILVELRMAPQFHKWIYGYRAGSFRSVRRWGGWRPMVFMHSGLALGVFMAAMTVAAATLARLRIQVFRLTGRLIAVYLFGILVLCKSSAAILYAMILVPVAAMAKSGRMAQVAVLVSVLIISYPALRMSGLFPTESLAAYARVISEERAHSMEYRFDAEDALLTHAMERPIFGWGAGGRSFVYDPRTGRVASNVDGAWIIWLGQGGVVRWIACYGLLVWPILAATRNLRRIPSRRDRIMLAGLILVVMIFALDLLPNGLFTNYPIFLAGALLQLSRTLRKPSSKARSRPEGAGPKLEQREVRRAPGAGGVAGPSSLRGGRGAEDGFAQSSQESSVRPRNIASSLLGDSKRRRRSCRTSGSKESI